MSTDTQAERTAGRVEDKLKEEELARRAQEAERLSREREERSMRDFDREMEGAYRNAPPPDKVRYDNPRWRRRGHAFLPRKPKPAKGIYLGTYRDSKQREWHLRADGVQPRGVLIMGPPGIGKSASYFITTLLTFEESAFVYDPKGELFTTTAGFAKALGHKVLLFAPTQDPERSCHINPFDSIRWGTRHEIADVQNVVKLILDPKDKAAEGAEAHWIVTGSILLECVILWLHYVEPDKCNLKGCYDYLTDPKWVNLDTQEDKKKPTTAVEEALKHMLKMPHSPGGGITEALANGWLDSDDNPSPYHPYVVHSAVEVQGKAPNEKSGVVSTTTRFLHPFRDGILAELTSYSDVSFDDLMNHEVPVRLYFWIPPADIQRLRVVVSLFMQLLVRAHTGDNALEYRNGVAYYRYKHRLLLAIDEYPQLGKQEQFILALAVIRSYGLWPMLGVQSFQQLADVLGPRQSLTAMMFYKVFLKPNDIEDAEWISKNIGNTTAREEKVSYSGNRFGMLTHKSVSIEYSRVPLMQPDTVKSMPQSAAIVIAGSVDPDQWDNPIWAGRLFWENVPELRRRSGNAAKGGQYPAPERSDVVIHHPPRKQSRHVADLLAATDETLRASAAGANVAQAAAASAAAGDAGGSAVATAEREAPASTPIAPVTSVADAAVADANRIVHDDATARILAEAARAAAGDGTPDDGEDPENDGDVVLEEAAVEEAPATAAPAAIEQPAAPAVASVAPITPEMQSFLALGDDAASPPLSDELEGEELDRDLYDDPTFDVDDGILYQPEEDELDQ